jgi:pimeloyl-ACP methyl ester carboxylesterase
MAGLSVAALASGGNVGSVSAQTSPKTFVLVHGAWHGGWCWRRLSDLLEKAGHKVFSPTLTGLGERSHLLSKDVNLDTHITDIVNVFKWEDLKDACLVAHSYGGYPSSGALEQISDRVSAIVWLDSFLPENGQRPIDLTTPVNRAIVLAGNSVPKADVFLVNEKDRAWVDSKLTPQPPGTYLQPMRLTGARERVARKVYIRATKYPNQRFEAAFTACKADASWRTFETSATGHDVMIDAPGWLSEVLPQIA